MWWFIILAGLGSTFADHQPSYFITTTSSIHRGIPFNISVDILNTTQTVHIRAEIQRIWSNYTNYIRIPVSWNEGDFVKGTTGTLSVQVPLNLDANRYLLHIRGSHGLQFERETSLSLDYQSVSLFIQTDKAMYKPGQIVRFRTFGVYPDLQVYNGEYNVYIYDPNGNMIKKWTSMQDVSGVVANQFLLADRPIQGDWEIRVQLPSQPGVQKKTFTVQQYELPRFEVTVDLPPFALTSDSGLSGTVKAKYTFGKPVKGMVELHVHLDKSNDYCGRPPKYVELAFPINGDQKFSVPISDIQRLQHYLNNQRIVVEAIVKEELTGVRLNGSSKVTFHTHPYKIEFLDSSTKAFKPGLPDTAYIKVSQQDGTPVTGSLDDVRVYTCINYEMHFQDQQYYSCSSFTGRYPLPGKNYTLPASGVLPIDMQIPENTNSINVKAHYKDISTTLNVHKSISNSKSYIQLSLLDKGVKAGQMARFQIEHTEPISTVSYEVLSRGTVNIIDQLTITGGGPATFSIHVTAAMAPTAHIVAYYVRKDGEVVADALSFNVDDVFDNKVTVDFSRNSSEPHLNIDVHMTADPQSHVNLLAVDQSVLLLKSGNDITTDEVLKKLKTFDTATSVHFDSDVFAVGSGATTANGVFSNAGVQVLTDANLYQPYFPGVVPTAMPGMVVNSLTTGHGMITNGLLPYKGPSSSLKEVDRVRNIFPETWLWVNQTVGADGRATISSTIPDTITSWIASAFAVNSVSGLGVAPYTTKLQVFRPFFVTLNMPSSVLRGEDVVIQVNVFNYLPNDIDVVISLPQSSDYMSVIVDSSGHEQKVSQDQKQYITVKSNEPHAVYFPIIPTNLGSIDIEVSARSTKAADAVRRQLLVEPEGVPKEYNIPVYIDLQKGTVNVTRHIPVSLPQAVVAGSQKAFVKATGDLLGPSIQNLDSLLKLPTGCGEQNMMTFAPDVFIADYLTATNQLTPLLQERITRYLELGYQRELTYQRKDGSFSAFGERDAAGSMWLTAFVSRVFHQARPYIFVYDQTLVRSLKWIASRQNLDGSFSEQGVVLDRQMQGDSGSGPALTAFVLLSLLENQDMYNKNIMTEHDVYLFGNTTNNATSYLESVASAISDSFTEAIVSYALTLAGSARADSVFTKLVAQAQVKSGMKFWTKPVLPTTSKYYTAWRPPHVRARPIDIQITSYALLAYSARHDLTGGIEVMKWLTSQRNPYGGFSSTQDTVVALQALTHFSRQAHSSGYKVDINVQAGSENHHLAIDNTNTLVLQSRQLSSFPSDVTFTATGNGIAIAELDMFFNVESEIGEPAFEINTVLLDDTLNSFRLMTCTKWLLSGKSGMVTQEIGIPSGFEPDLSTIGNVAGLKRAERQGRNVVVYFDEIGTTSVCFDMLSTRNGMVAKNQKSYVVVYDYYEPDNQATMFYQPRSLKTATICDICTKCCPQA